MPTVPVIEVSSVTHLGQLLKLTGLAEDGATTRVLIQGGDVLVNDVVEACRGRQLSHDDMIEVDSSTGRAGARIHVID